jgi:cation:H+ antiporter
MTTAIVLLILGIIILVFSADFLVKGASRLATAVGVSPLVVGLTVVAFGTSAPELSVSVMSAYKGQADIALGNVVGSNIFNVLGILGVSALIIPLVVHRQLVRFDVPVMIGCSLLLMALCWDGMISRVDGIVLFAVAIWYTVMLIRISRRENKANVALAAESGLEAAEKKNPKWAINIGFIVLGLAGLMLGSKWLVDSSVLIARYFGVSELVIGLTIVSIGTSLPEVATSVVAALKGERDIAVGNVIGSNIFNIATVLGLASIISPHGIAVATSALHFDIPVMIAVALACLPIFFRNYIITRINGAVFLAFYVAYVMFVIMASTQHDSLDEFRTALFWYVAPLTVATLGFIVWRGYKERAMAANAAALGQ